MVQEIYSKGKESPDWYGKIKETPSLLIKLLDLIREEIPSKRASILLVDENSRVVFKEPREESYMENSQISLEIIKQTFEEKNPIILNNLKSDLCPKKSEGVESVLCLPLNIDNRAAGAIYLERKTGFRPFSRKDLEFLVALSKPINLILRNLSEFQKLRNNTSVNQEPFLVGKGRASRHVLSLIERVKDNDTPVFIVGESGTGKELVARAIHERGSRRRGRFVAVNCGAIPDPLLESELFGYVKGAFTGALRDKPGLIDEAHKGTFFLDEIGDLSPHLQAKLLRLLQEKEIRRIGENKTRVVDVRFISATNKNIEEEIERGNFREDLYYRLKIITIELPPLRERKEDILCLLNHFVEKYCREMNREKAYFSPQALELLLNYSWPGNIRELQNEIQRCLVFSGEDNLIKEEYLYPNINPHKERYASSSYDYFRAKAEFEKRFLNQALARWNYNRAKTAENIGLSRQGLFKLLKKHKIDVPKKREMGSHEAVVS